jgi:uncharacterized Zn-finger protein
MVPRLTDEQLLVLKKPKSDEHLKSADTMIPVLIATKELTKRRIKNYQFSCNVCNKHFNLRSAMKRHMQRHTQLRTFHCDVPGCTYSAKVPIDLYMHKKNVHTSILYTCLLCGKNFKTHSVYKLHAGKHNTETAGVFKCLYQKCRKLVKNISDLQKHIKEAQEEVKNSSAMSAINFTSPKEC